jgi:aminomethyltransferase
MIDRAIARHGFPVVASGQRVGVVTSGTQTPFLKKAIGMAYVPAASAAAGSEIDIDVRGKTAKARIVSLPFYKRERSG